MENIAFWSAAGLSAIWLGVHLIIGGRQIAGPLLAASELAPVVRNTQYLCWHFTSLTIASVAGFFAWAAFSSDHAFAFAGAVLATGMFLVGVVLVAAMGERHTQLPQGWLFLPVAALGWAGLVL